MVSNIFKHFKTITTHKFYVFIFACKAGIPYRGLIHDMSKFSPTEFFESVKYYQGDKSPITAAKKQMDIQKLGYIIKEEINIIGSIGTIL